MRRSRRKPTDDELLATFQRLIFGTRGRPLVAFVEQYPEFQPALIRLVDLLIGPNPFRFLSLG